MKSPPEPRRTSRRISPAAGEALIRNRAVEKKTSLVGFAIVVLDRGFVYVGHTECDGDWCIITDAKNIRVWGTERGLGQLALSGPTDKTRLDAVGVVRAPMRAVISVIESEAGKWTSK